MKMTFLLGMGMAGAAGLRGPQPPAEQHTQQSCMKSQHAGDKQTAEYRLQHRSAGAPATCGTAHTTAMLPPTCSAWPV
jgi:hypothetical protein